MTEPIGIELCGLAVGFYTDKAIPASLQKAVEIASRHTARTADACTQLEDAITYAAGLVRTHYGTSGRFEREFLAGVCDPVVADAVTSVGNPIGRAHRGPTTVRPANVHGWTPGVMSLTTRVRSRDGEGFTAELGADGLPTAVRVGLAVLVTIARHPELAPGLAAALATVDARRSVPVAPALA